MRLPFEVNEVWYVIQGYDDPGSSHNGYAAFCYDFGKHPYDSKNKKEHPLGTSNAPVYAAATAKVDLYSKFCGGGQQSRLTLGENEHMTYMHTAKGTFNAKFTGGNIKSTHQPCADECAQVECEILPAQAQTVLQGDLIAKVNPADYHLHFATGNGKSGTFPAAFADYEVSTDDGKTWTKVFRGHPKAGQLIRRTGISAAQKTVSLQCSTSNVSVTQKQILGNTKFEHKAFVSITTGSSFVPAGTIIKYSVNGYPPKSFKVEGELGIPPFKKQGLGWYTILLDEKEPWPDGCSASYTNK